MTDLILTDAGVICSRQGKCCISSKPVYVMKTTNPLVSNNNNNDPVPRKYL
jgi:hypothetical protein